MISPIVNHLRTNYGKGKKIAIAYVYCNYREQTEQSVSNLVASLLKQLVQDHSTTVKELLYKKHIEQNTRPIYNESLQAPKSQISTFFGCSLLSMP